MFIKYKNIEKDIITTRGKHSIKFLEINFETKRVSKTRESD